MRRQPRFEDYWAVDAAKLRPGDAYKKMKAVRAERMSTYLDERGELRGELLEEIVCPICQAPDYEKQFEKEGFRFVRCTRCDLVYVNPALREDEVKDVYADESYSDIIRALMDDSNVYRRERFGRERMDIIEAHLGASGETAGALLEIGCATGFFLEEARSRGWQAFGVEANPYAAQYAQSRGLEVRHEMIEESSFDDQSFDAVAAFEVIEHLRDPMLFLQSAHRLLKPGGMLFLYTPNFNCAERLLLGTESHFIWGCNHLTYFTPATLTTAVEGAGLEVVHWETQGLDVEDLIWHYRATGQYPTGLLEEFRHRLQFLFNAASWGKNLRLYARRPSASRA